LSKAGMNIREMSAEDLEGIFRIERESTGNKRASTFAPVPESCIGGEIDSSVVAEEDDHLVGFILGRTIRSPIGLNDIAWIEFIGIHPDYQRRGIGRKMLENWKELCRKKGITRVHIMLSERDKWMQSFFESQGFSRGDLVDYQARL